MAAVVRRGGNSVFGVRPPIEFLCCGEARHSPCINMFLKSIPIKLQWPFIGIDYNNVCQNIGKTYIWWET